MLRLTEWRPSEPLELTHAERLALERHFDARVESTANPALFRVVPGNIVGSLDVGGRIVTVVPKIPIDRVLFMTAFTADPFRWRDELASLGRNDNLVLGMARLFVRSCHAVLAKGILRSYRAERGNLPYVRGRVEWARQARRPLPVPLAVAYRVHDDDIVENQIVRVTLGVLRALVHGAIEADDVQADLNRLWRQFREFADLQAPLAALDHLVWTRQNEHYRPLLDLCRVVLENDMAEIEAGAVAIHGFTLRMPDLFERFVRRAMEHYSGLSLATPVGRTLSLDVEGRVGLHPDLAARPSGRWTFIGDVKYKRDNGRGKNADLYQLLAYATAAQLRQATLIYADGPDDATEHAVRFAGISLHVKRVDLQQQPEQVLQKLAEIWEGASSMRAPSAPAVLGLQPS